MSQYRPPSPTSPSWHKSSYSGSEATACVETAYMRGPNVYIRDSKHIHGGILVLSVSAWQSFATATGQGRFDRRAETP